MTHADLKKRLAEQDSYERAREEVDQVRRMTVTAETKGRVEGAAALIARQVARRLGRVLEEREMGRLRAAVARDGAESVDDALCGLDEAGVEAWLREAVG